ncbi:depupylase/deamidase Dop [Bifidobacterium parmae]|uniref:Ligase n=1 Tax=Bifidobacterium parmae TaxID=361854 RepID=A0A2N5J425_9BIFI|nr:depupylase/deamidase Dop [Bifidobacterium parmae]PLS28937.1 ligase [Bifidobacterium parmae]
MTVRRVMGTETEYAVSQPGVAYYQPVKLSFDVVGAAADDATRHIRWDYRQEDPVNDARGTRLDRAAARPDMLTDAPQLNITNVIAPNGGRIYVDHAHPEYSAPETTDPFQALLYDHAGDRLMLAAARAASAADPEPEASGHPVVLHRNNVDGKGASWGTHENYMMRRDVPFADVAALMTAHFVSRQIWAGSGRVGIGEASETPGFQLSQRADTIHAKIGLQTTFDRPIINTRDESHSTGAFRRLHVIVGDANRMDVPQALKLGVTSILLWTLEHAREAGYDLDALLGSLQLADPVEAMHTVSHDLTLTAALPLETGGTTTAWLMQVALRRAVYEVAAATLGTDTKGEPAWEDRETRNIMAMWGQALADTAAIRHADDDTRLTMKAEAGRVEWLLKWQLLEKLRRKIARATRATDTTGTGAASWADARLAAVDLSWAALDPAKSVFARLAAAGSVERLVDDDALDRAAHNPPETTRAWLRAALVRTFPADVVAASWSHLTVRKPAAGVGDDATGVRPGDLVSLDMSDPLAFRKENVETALAEADDAASLIERLALRR